MYYTWPSTVFYFILLVELTFRNQEIPQKNSGFLASFGKSKNQAVLTSSLSQTSSLHVPSHTWPTNHDCVAWWATLLLESATQRQMVTQNLPNAICLCFRTLPKASLNINHNLLRTKAKAFSPSSLPQIIYHSDISVCQSIYSQD